MFELLLKELILKLETPQSWAVIGLFLLVWAIKSFWEWFINDFKLKYIDKLEAHIKSEEVYWAENKEEQLAQREINASLAKFNEIVMKKIVEKL